MGERAVGAGGRDDVGAQGFPQEAHPLRAHSTGDRTSSSWVPGHLAESPSPLWAFHCHFRPLRRACAGGHLATTAAGPSSEPAYAKARDASGTGQYFAAHAAGGCQETCNARKTSFHPTYGQFQLQQQGSEVAGIGDAGGGRSRDRHSRGIRSERTLKDTRRSPRTVSGKPLRIRERTRRGPGSSL